MELNLNNPYFTYPGVPFHGYLDFLEYNKELIRFLRHLENLDCDNIRLLHINIGAAMEEVPETPDYEKYTHWRQLFPYHVEEFVLNYPFEMTEIIIISPNETFSKSKYKNPLFIKRTNDLFEWEYISDRTYMSKKYPVRVLIFHTMLPTNNLKRNKKILEKIHSLNYDNVYTELLLLLEQTPEDLKFIKKFYEIIGTKINTIAENRGLVSCFSFAVFREGSEYSCYNDYQMFEEIKNLFNKESIKKTILCRWIFSYESTNMIVFNSSNSLIKYVFNNNDSLKIKGKDDFFYLIIK